MAITNQILSTSGVKTAMGVAKEVNYGVPVTPSVYLPFTTSNLTAENKLITRQAIRKSKGMPPPGIGTVEVKGDVTIEADADSCGFLIANTMGVDTVTAAASGSYSHTMKLAQGLNSLTFSQDDAGGYVYQYVGCKVDSLEFSCKPDGFLEIKSTVMGQTVQASTSPGFLTPTYSSLPPFEFAHLSVSAGGVSLLNGVSEAINDFTITLSNGLKQHWASIGGRTLVGINETLAMVKGSMNIDYTDNSINQILWGSATTPSPGAISQVPLTFTFYQGASTANGNIARSLTLTLPAITLINSVVTPKRNDILTQAITFQANESAFLAQDDLTVVLTNTTSASYAP